MKDILLRTTLAMLFLAAGCTGVPQGLTPVTGFELDRYLGRWYEIARLDHSFERHLSHVTAVYSRNPDGTLRVVNRGYDTRSGDWRQIEGRARFLGEDTVGSLKVSFFGPFYGGYHIIALDRSHYRHAMVTGPSRSYLWILARDRTLDPAVYQGLVDMARRWGFEASALIAVDQGLPEPASK